MDDFVGRPITPGSLLISMFSRKGITPINGGFGTVGVGNWSRAVDYVSTGLRNNVYNHATLAGMPTEANAMGDLISRTNPSRPDFTPLSILQDLYDLPRMIQDVGGLLRGKSLIHEAKNMADWNLAVSFGWVPFIKDLQNLMAFTRHVHKRKAELQRLYQASGLKRRIYLGRYTGTSSVNQTVQSRTTLFHSVNVETITIAERWGTVRWIPEEQFPWFDPLYLFRDGDQFRPSEAELIDKAWITSSGMTPEAASQGAWDLIPWSFLIDYFDQVGDYAVRYSNTIPAKPTEACIMTLTDSVMKVKTLSLTSGYTGGSGSFSRLTKQRYTGPAAQTAHLPFINGNRLSILGSLFVQRFKRRRQ